MVVAATAAAAAAASSVTKNPSACSSATGASHPADEVFCVSSIGLVADAHDAQRCMRADALMGPR